MATTQPRDHPDLGRWLARGAIGGLVAGISFAVVEMLAAGLLIGAFFMPLRMIAAIVLGPDALQPTYSLGTAALTGVLVHLVLAVVFGLVFGVIAALVSGMAPPFARSTAALLGAASAYGLVLWLVNFYVIAPIAGWFWFPAQSHGVVQFLAHTFFYGTVLGIYCAFASIASTGARVYYSAAEGDVRQAS